MSAPAPTPHEHAWSDWTRLIHPFLRGWRERRCACGAYQRRKIRKEARR